MSVLIKGMEMPKNCYEFRFCVDGWCYVIPPETRAEKERITTNYCPLISVPPHGDLIDRDALFKIDRYVYGNSGLPIGERHNFYDDEIRDAPTIIESDGE